MSQAYSAELVSLLLAGGEPSAADRAVKAAQQSTYVRIFWTVLASLIVLVAIGRIASYLALRFQLSLQTTASSVEAGNGAADKVSSRKQICLRRLPLVCLNALRIVSFRWRIKLLPCIIFSMSEATFIGGYISLAMLLAFVNSMWHYHPDPSPTLIWSAARHLQIMLWEDRAAHIASCQVPLIVALAGKNNVITCTPKYELYVN